MNILFTNTALDTLGGTEGVVRDVCAGLKRLGHHPMVFSPRLGFVAKQIAAQGIEVADHPSRLSRPPDFIYGHHFMETMMALTYFPDTPALYHCHGWAPWEETPPVHPRIHLYIAIGKQTAERVRARIGPDGPDIRIIYNGVDTRRFRQVRSLPPPALRRAVIYDRYLNDTQSREIVEACRLRGIACTAFAGLSPPVLKPEDLLPLYDVVFAVGKSAIEALAAGAAVIVCSGSGLGSLIDDDNVAFWQSLNYSAASDKIPVTTQAVGEQLRRYRPDNQQTVTAFVRRHASLDRYLEQIVQAMEDAIAISRSQPRPSPEAERAASCQHLLETKAILGQLAGQAGLVGQANQRADRAEAQCDLLRRELDVMCAQLDAVQNALMFRLHRRLISLPRAGRLLDRLLLWISRWFPAKPS